jgi:hypothetical protein
VESSEQMSQEDHRVMVAINWSADSGGVRGDARWRCSCGASGDGEGWTREQALEAAHRHRAARVVHAELFHISASSNRASIEQYGLDSRRKGNAPTIKGMDESDGTEVWVCEWDDVWLVGNGATFHTDVWSIRCENLVCLEAGNGYLYLADPVPPELLRLVIPDIAPVSEDEAELWGKDKGI